MTRVSRSGADLRGAFSMTGYACDEVNSNVIAFEEGANDKIFLIRKSYAEQSKDSTQAMYTAVRRSNMQPIAQSFEIKALPTDSTGTLIDMTDYISGDNIIFHFNAESKKTWKLGPVLADRSHIVEVQSFPMNTNIKAVKTYGHLGPGNPGANAGAITLELTTSILALPEQPMKPRYNDPRVGYFTVDYIDYDENPQGVKRKKVTSRWRLEPKEEDIERYKRGELVEPKKPIVIYIDPTTPEKWIPYLLQGVNDWQKAFEKAGFKNAIIGKRAPSPAEDPTWNMDDARNSMIVYKASAVGNATGPSTADPRSGEILETHINWYHNVMEVLRNWYFIQAAAIDPRARTLNFDDELMDELIRFVSSHEVGHALGMRHNFISSAVVPVEKLRDRAWLEKNGHTPSIMDYARFNYVAQPEDNVGERGIFPRIGDYDEWAVEWAYRWTDLSEKEETKYFSKLTLDKQSNPRLWFGTELSRNDPRLQSEALGDNAMIASDYGVKNLKRIIAGLPEWTATPNEGYESLAAMYNEVYQQFNRYVGHVLKNVSGVYETAKTIEQPGPIYEDVEKETQVEAMTWLANNVFNEPTWLIDREISSRINLDEIGMVTRLQNEVFDRLFNVSTFEKLIAAEIKSGNKAYTINDLTDALYSSIWTDLKSGKEINVFRRNLQKNFISRMDDILNPPSKVPDSPVSAISGAIFIGVTKLNNKNDAYPLLKAKTKDLRRDIQRSIAKQKDEASKNHLIDMLDRIDTMLASKK